ncbi:ester hydrolase C11orf54-like [Anneissia japonica]|uniref:ester hydrolase C11orf54-like n=1 Tax=Anneissia japonica TaxID=1529436 RepID=UPI0014258292|nr:ester hydrolase C11orf54-like [Anneissia japonica]
MAQTSEKELKVDSRKLFVPDKQELCKVLVEGLKENFADASVSVVDCPDLTQLPFTLASPGLCGNPRLADVGGVPNLIPLANKEKKYDIEKVAELVDLPGAYVLGAGAGCYQFFNFNCEMMANIKTKGGQSNERRNCTRISKVNPEDGSCVLQTCETTCFSLMANLFLSDGKPGKVIKVRASKRTGEENFVTCMRKTLAKKYGDKTVGLGGTFLIEQGKAKFHVMPDYSKTPLNTNDDVNNWLKFYEMMSPLVCFSCFLSHDPGLDLRLEHSHGFGHHGVGGHYHYDVTPDEVVYEAYYQVAETIYRVDAPTETHNVGRD